MEFSTGYFPGYTTDDSNSTTRSYTTTAPPTSYERRSPENSYLDTLQACSNVLWKLHHAAQASGVSCSDLQQILSAIDVSSARLQASTGTRSNITSPASELPYSNPDFDQSDDDHIDDRETLRRALLAQSASPSSRAPPPSQMSRTSQTTHHRITSSPKPSRSIATTAFRTLAVAGALGAAAYYLNDPSGATSNLTSCLGTVGAGLSTGASSIFNGIKTGASTVANSSAVQSARSTASSVSAAHPKLTRFATNVAINETMAHGIGYAASTCLSMSPTSRASSAVAPSQSQPSTSVLPSQSSIVARPGRRRDQIQSRTPTSNSPLAKSTAGGRSMASTLAWTAAAAGVVGGAAYLYCNPSAVSDIVAGTSEYRSMAASTASTVVSGVGKAVSGYGATALSTAGSLWGGAASYWGKSNIVPAADTAAPVLEALKQVRGHPRDFR